MTSRPHALRNRQVTHLAAGVLSMTTTAALTACGENSDTEAQTRSDTTSSARPTPTGIVTKAAASKIVNNYEKVNNRANATQDEKLLATVEGGQVHEQSQADYEQFKTWSAKKKEYASSFSYQDRSYWLPAAGTASWFAVTGTSNASDSHILMIFDKVGATYKMVAAVYSDTPIPEIAVDRYGLATEVDPSKKVGTLAPNELGGVYEDLFETGGKKAGKQLASTESTKESVSVYEDRDDGDAARWATKKFFAKDPAHKKVYALKLASGGVLAVFPTAHTQELMLKPEYMGNSQINPNKTEAVYNSTPRTVVIDHFEGQGFAELTPNGKPKVTAMEYRMVDSR
ncbi:hypothetical protein ACFV80_43330 [Streptomyces sp. NPDC059862]|uniref:hypothetical protein n=1 Tax=Streptomyces sp. NPDC059862 TaxID=3346975 RepID=UPI00365DCC60